MLPTKANSSHFCEKYPQKSHEVFEGLKKPIIGEQLALLQKGSKENTCFLSDRSKGSQGPNAWKLKQRIPHREIKERSPAHR